jgi:hypothetical protein
MRGQFAGKQCKLASLPSTTMGRTIWIVDAHGYGKRFIVRSGEQLTAFVELEAAIWGHGELSCQAARFLPATYALRAFGSVMKRI